MRVTRAASDAVPALGRRARRRPRPRRRAPRMRCPSPGRSASDTTTSAVRADPAAIASAPRRAAPPCPRAASPRAGRRRIAAAGPSADGEHGVARALGERWTGGAPPEAVDVVGLEPGRRRAQRRSLRRQREHVLVGRADRDLAPPAATAPGRGDVSGRQPPSGRGRAHSQDPNRGSHARILGRACSRGPQGGRPVQPQHERREHVPERVQLQRAVRLTQRRMGAAERVEERAGRDNSDDQDPEPPVGRPRPAADREASTSATTAPATSTASSNCRRRARPRAPPRPCRLPRRTSPGLRSPRRRGRAPRRSR